MTHRRSARSAVTAVVTWLRTASRSRPLWTERARSAIWRRWAGRTVRGSLPRGASRLRRAGASLRGGPNRVKPSRWPRSQRSHAAKLGEHVWVAGLIPVPEAAPDELHVGGPGRAPEHVVLAVEEVGGVRRVGGDGRREAGTPRRWRPPDASRPARATSTRSASCRAPASARRRPRATAARRRRALRTPPGGTPLPSAAARLAIVQAMEWTRAVRSFQAHRRHARARDGRSRWRPRTPRTPRWSPAWSRSRSVDGDGDAGELDVPAEVPIVEARAERGPPVRDLDRPAAPGVPLKKTRQPNLGCRESLRWCVGGAEGIRTPDPKTASLVLSQLSYSPTRRVTVQARIEGCQEWCRRWDSNPHTLAGSGF